MQFNKMKLNKDMNFYNNNNKIKIYVNFNKTIKIRFKKIKIKKLIQKTQMICPNQV